MMHLRSQRQFSPSIVWFSVTPAQVPGLGGKFPLPPKLSNQGVNLKKQIFLLQNDKPRMRVF